MGNFLTPCKKHGFEMPQRCRVDLRPDVDPMKTSSVDNWYAFHFGSKFVSSPEFNPEALYDGSNRDCYVMMADFCSFTAFFKATEHLKIIEHLMTGFYSEIRKAVHNHSGMLDKIMGDAVVAVWGLHVREEKMIRSVLEAANELVQITNQVAMEWQSQIDLLIEPKGLKIGLSKGPVIVIPRDRSYPGLSLLGNSINLASRLQAAAQANQLICSNQVHRDVEQSGSKVKFQPYKNQANDEFLEARNYGPIKAWVTDIAPQRSDRSR
jgi:class 3 adenylate cyclase